jgi:hypothetical protein
MASKHARLKVNGSGRLNVERLATPKLQASLAGSGRMQVKGVAEKAKFEIAGSGTIDATELKTRDKNSRTSGSGRILLL